LDPQGAGYIGKMALATAAAGRAGNVGTQTDAANALKRQQAAQEFASLLFLEVLKAMRAALPDEGLFETESLSRDIYTSMMDAEVARVMAKRDATGFAKTVEQSLAKTVQPARPQDAAISPVEGPVSSVYGVRTDPFGGPAKLPQGVDIAAPAGTPVRAAAAGRVVFSGRVAGYGNTVEVTHGDGLFTRYAHNSDNLVSVGQEIQAGQILALVGSSGRSTGPHLHFEVLRSGKPVDPAALYGPVAKGTKFSSAA
jgi:murein DD-endopeptidase MepM/ murein hydrolase activator NlpD